MHYHTRKRPPCTCSLTGVSSVLSLSASKTRLVTPFYMYLFLFAGCLVTREVCHLSTHKWTLPQEERRKDTPFCRNLQIFTHRNHTAIENKFVINSSATLCRTAFKSPLEGQVYVAKFFVGGEEEQKHGRSHGKKKLVQLRLKCCLAKVLEQPTHRSSMMPLPHPLRFCSMSTYRKTQRSSQTSGMVILP